MKNVTLVIMAAGIGSRFGGGIKQLEPVGPNGEIIMDYSIHDALEAGCNKVVFIIRKDIEKDFKEIIGKRIEKLVPVEYAYQSVDELPGGRKNTWGRTKPWGTGQAVLCVKDIVKEPFIVINADDYYGKEAFAKLYQYMTTEMDVDAPVYDICMAGFILSNTLSENGGVTRGVCTVDEDGYLQRVTETYEIRMKDGELAACDDEKKPVSVNAGQHVSMNMWGLPPRFLELLEGGFAGFLDELGEDAMKKEYLLPKIIDKLLAEQKARVKVLETGDRWFGVTYKEDKQVVVDSIRELIAKGIYKDELFS
ncbi:nucleotidyltransferase [Clostridium sp. AF37-5AT]|nr:sugar phosphate nucleotidyltransferase [Clostridium sp. AF37-5AT]RHO94574.1 nucleotidyltransferase [Clostridium sp. AF37-5AT]